MARERQRTLPPLEMDCYDPGQNIPLEFALAIKRAVCFAAVGGALFIALVIGSAYHVFIR